MPRDTQLDEALKLLNLHRTSFAHAVPYATSTKHPVPTDTRAWSQILVSLLTGIDGIARKKGADLADGSDVKAANVWEAIDTPRFNGCIKSGRKGEVGSISCLDDQPYLFFVMWDYEPTSQTERCRVWVVRTQVDPVFRGICELWYRKRDEGLIRSDNFQLHPPRNLNSNTFRNTCGNLDYPLLFRAEWNGSEFVVSEYNLFVLDSGVCSPAT